MHISSRSLFLAISFIATLSSAPHALSMEGQAPLPQKRWSSASTIATGIALGATNGILSRITDSVWPLNWLLLNQIQAIATKAIVNDAERSGEILDVSLLNDSTWISSWISYIAAIAKIHIRHSAEPYFVVYR